MIVPFTYDLPLVGQLILLLDDEAVAASTEDMLHYAGAEVALAHNSYQAILVARRRALTAAVLDASACKNPEGICAQLALQTVPFLFLVGSDETVGRRGGPVVRQPIIAKDLVGALVRILAAPVASRAS